MSLTEFEQLFGPASSWVAGAMLLSLGLLLTVGFVQNREVTIWPPKIGVRAERFEGPGPRRASWRLRGRRDATGADDGSGYDEVFEVDKAAEFCERIAPVYDSRNSRDLVATHLATIALVQGRLATRPALKVLDLGGGTGNPIATHFFGDQSVEWTYVDVCPALAKIFRRSLDKQPLGRNLIIETDDLNQAIRRLPAQRYDVVLLSLVLTSMPALPNFADIGRLLAPGGTLVVTDIGPGYTRLKPYYGVHVHRRSIALHTVAVDPVEVRRRATAAGLVACELTPLGDDDPYYSFVCTFTAPSRSGP
jgi:SAM-dependent methyltransferase